MKTALAIFFVLAGCNSQDPHQLNRATTYYGADDCPDGPRCQKKCSYPAYYYPNGQGDAFCVDDYVYYDIPDPTAPQLPPTVGTVIMDCTHVNQDVNTPIPYVGFWYQSAGNEMYNCPAGFAHVPDETADWKHCVQPAWPPHANTFAYCDYFVEDTNFHPIGWGYKDQ